MALTAVPADTHVANVYGVQTDATERYRVPLVAIQTDPISVPYAGKSHCTVHTLPSEKD